uniref:Uncharacterized protein n=1 Tax=Romanomermis culicivorax TaxID=13658 RepID=A0A915HEE4_ROMCU
MVPAHICQGWKDKVVCTGAKTEEIIDGTAEILLVLDIGFICRKCMRKIAGMLSMSQNFINRMQLMEDQVKKYTSELAKRYICEKIDMQLENDNDNEIYKMITDGARDEEWIFTGQSLDIDCPL